MTALDTFRGLTPTPLAIPFAGQIQPDGQFNNLFANNLIANLINGNPPITTVSTTPSFTDQPFGGVGVWTDITYNSGSPITPVAGTWIFWSTGTILSTAAGNTVRVRFLQTNSDLSTLALQATQWLLATNTYQNFSLLWMGVMSGTSNIRTQVLTNQASGGNVVNSQQNGGFIVGLKVA